MSPEYVLTDAAKEAIARARFKTANIAHTWAIVYDTDADLIAQTGLNFARYERARGSGIYDHEARSYEPAVVEYVSALGRG